jgi:hypothetical protein
MQAENLWGEIPKKGNLRTPITILREQAGLLGQATNNVLEGDVSMGRDAFGSEFQITLSIVAPALDNYRFALVRVMHELMLYPLTVFDLVNDVRYDCDGEETFLRALKQILSSQGTHRVIDSLLSQSQAA